MDAAAARRAGALARQLVAPGASGSDAGAGSAGAAHVQARQLGAAPAAAGSGASAVRRALESEGVTVVGDVQHAGAQRTLELWHSAVEIGMSGRVCCRAAFASVPSSRR
jgi:hypothetical protein